jgi:hypothetical protein
MLARWISSPSPATPQPRPSERRVERQAEEIDIGKVDWDEILVAFRIGNIPWPRVLGAEPGDPNCRAPAAALKRNGFA